ncbi:MAG: DUF5131 family protein [Planctomycetota bacterium]
MAEQTTIEWCDHTASPWHGCQKVHTGCANCYAETMSKRNPATLGKWGPAGTRVKSKSFVRKLRKWNAEAAAAGTVKTVFPSLCDPFEDRPELEPWRREMFDVIDECPNLRLLLLTKRPENIPRMWPAAGNGKYTPRGDDLDNLLPLRTNVWLLASVSDQATADTLVPQLLHCRYLAPVLGLSCEPLLGPIDLTRLEDVPGEHRNCLTGEWRSFVVDGVSGCVYEDGAPSIDWIIAGGESGPRARPMHPDWPRSLRDQCAAAGVLFFFKQWGEWIVASDENLVQHRCERWDAEASGSMWLDVDGRRQRPSSHGLSGEAFAMFRVGKQSAGRLLDGVTHDEIPQLENNL